MFVSFAIVLTDYDLKNPNIYNNIFEPLFKYAKWTWQWVPWVVGILIGDRE